MDPSVLSEKRVEYDEHIVAKKYDERTGRGHGAGEFAHIRDQFGRTLRSLTRVVADLGS